MFCVDLYYCCPLFGGNYTQVFLSAEATTSGEARGARRKSLSYGTGLVHMSTLPDKAQLPDNNTLLMQTVFVLMVPPKSSQALKNLLQYVVLQCLVSNEDFTIASSWQKKDSLIISTPTI